MTLCADTKYDIKALDALVKVNTFKGRKPQAEIAVISILCLIAIIEAVVLFAINGYSVFYVLMIAISVVCELVYLLVYFFPSIFITCNFTDCNFHFEFSDDVFTVFVDGSDINYKEQIAYKTLHAIYETDDYLFLFEKRGAKKRANIVDKSGIKGGTSSDIKKLLFASGVKYIRCKF